MPHQLDRFEELLEDAKGKLPPLETCPETGLSCTCSLHPGEEPPCIVRGDAMRTFESGATRSAEEGKLDYEGFLSPLVLKAFAQYMNTHRRCPDGTVRDSDNWQKGMPLAVYMKSMWRHFMDVWSHHRGISTPDTQRTNLCALLFNVQGYLHELEKEENQSFVSEASGEEVHSEQGTPGIFRTQGNLFGTSPSTGKLKSAPLRAVPR